MGLATIPALPYMFDEPVEHVIDYVFDQVEHFLFSSSSDKSKSTEELVEKSKSKVEELTEKGKDSLEKTKASLEKVKDSINPNGGLASKALILGIGIDMLYLPRLKNLVNRQSSRILKQISKTGLSQESLSSSSIKTSSIALDRLANRVLCEKEMKEWKNQKESSMRDERLRWLAVR